MDARGGVSEETVQEVIEAYNYRCAVGGCGPSCSGRLVLHHIKYKSRGGSNRRTNLVLLCDKHHLDEHCGEGNGYSLRSYEDEPAELPWRGRRAIRS
ncbi:hypothetical protein LCGC14_1614810 [marine sediment metagenome]|uniref:HNH nuclease domain-containing protein n=1 Tax=marine sediment metagenome TaxID=412755 RepID=A0A0F9ITZ2_9ZZZZ